MARTRLGNRIFTEVQNPTLIPSQASPVHMEFQAFPHGSMVHCTGRAKIRPSVISPIGLNEVTTTT